MGKIKEFFRKLLGQPKRSLLRVVPPFNLDLKKHYNDLGYFFEEVLLPDETTPAFQELKKGTWIILARLDKESAGRWDRSLIDVDYDEKETNIETVQKNLRKLGINTKQIK